MQLDNVAKHINNFLSRFSDQVLPEVTKLHHKTEEVALGQEDLAGTSLVSCKFTQHEITADVAEMERLRQNSKVKLVFSGEGIETDNVVLETQAGYTIGEEAKTTHGRPGVSIQSPDGGAQAYEGYFVSVPGQAYLPRNGNATEPQWRREHLHVAFDDSAQVRVGNGKWTTLPGHFSQVVRPGALVPVLGPNQGMYSSTTAPSIGANVALSRLTELEIVGSDERILVTGNEVKIQRGPFKSIAGSILDDGSIQFIDPTSKLETAYKFPISPKVLGMI